MQHNVQGERRFSATSLAAINLLQRGGLAMLEREVGPYPILERILTRLFVDSSPIVATVGSNDTRMLFEANSLVGPEHLRIVVNNEIFGRFERNRVVHFCRLAGAIIEVRTTIGRAPPHHFTINRFRLPAFLLCRFVEDVIGIGGVASNAFVFMRSSSLESRNLLTHIYYLVPHGFPRPLLNHQQFQILIERENGGHFVSVESWNAIEHENVQERRRIADIQAQAGAEEEDQFLRDAEE